MAYWAGGWGVMSTVRIELSGFKELQTAIDKLPGNVDNRVLQAAVTGAIRQGAKEIRSSVPVGSEPRSINSQKYGSARKNIKVSRVRSAKKSGKGAKVTTGNAFWMWFYERGSRHQPARPWFAPAFARAKGAMLAELSDRIKTGVEREFSKMVKK